MSPVDYPTPCPHGWYTSEGDVCFDCDVRLKSTKELGDITKPVGGSAADRGAALLMQPLPLESRERGAELRRRAAQVAAWFDEETRFDEEAADRSFVPVPLDVLREVGEFLDSEACSMSLPCRHCVCRQLVRHYLGGGK